MADVLGGPIDLYLLHRDDPSVPVGTIIECLTALREAGLLRAYGTSNWTTERIDEANVWAAAHGLEGFCVSSQHLSLAVQNEEQWADTRSANDPDVYAWHSRTQTPLLAWSAQARGYFFGRSGPEVMRVYDNALNRERRARAGAVGARLGLSSSQVAGLGAAPAVPGVRRLRRQHRRSGAVGVRGARDRSRGARRSHGVTAPRMKSMMS